MVREQFWRWIRGDLDDAQFEQWVYANYDELERTLGESLLLDLIQLEFHANGGAIRKRLAQRFPPECSCTWMPDRCGGRTTGG